MDKAWVIKLFPNLFTSTFNLTIARPKQVNRIVILDMLGKQVETVETVVIKSDYTFGSSLKPGLYLIPVQGADRYQSLGSIKSK